MQLKKGQAQLFKKVESKHKRTLYQIDLILVPYLFNFCSNLLRFCKLSDQIKISNPVAFELFQYLKDKILPKRKYSKTGRKPTRMKTEQKIKFLMRCLENNLAKIYHRRAAKLINFNLEEQKTFFARLDVRQHFLKEVPKIIEEKQRENHDKIRAMQSIISNILAQTKTNQRQAKKMLENDIKQRQLPWTVDIFTDIQQFSQDIYRNFIEKPQKETQLSIQMRYRKPTCFSSELEVCLEQPECQEDSQLHAFPEIDLEVYVLKVQPESEVKQNEKNESQSTNSEVNPLSKTS